MSPQAIPANGVSCSEAISLLYLLHQVPAPPSRNLLTDYGIYAQGYNLSLKDELKLVETLAFLSNIEYNVDRIPAICIHQVPESSSINVLLAVNRTGAGDGNQYLQRLKEGFEPIFALLAKPRHSLSRHMMQDEVLAEIASMCSKRILHRLRLVAGRRGKPKQPIQAVLRTAIRGLKEVGNHFLSKHLPLSVAFVEKAKEAIRYADAWINHQTMPRLYDLVKAIHSLKHTGDIEAMLAILPTQVMDPSMGRNIVNILDKVARYCDASRLLVRMSKKHELIRRLKIVVVELPQSVWARPNDGVPNRTLASVFSQVSINSQNSSLAQVIRTLDITQTEANELFMAQTRKTMCEAKIHAEVQLVYYCELSPTKQPPRIIASNKDACYLCNAFMEMYGKLHTSRSHGRLYPGWRLPVIPNLRQMEETFTAVLEARIRASMATSLSRRLHSESTIVGGVGEGVEDLEELARLSVSGSSSSFSDSKSSIGREECKTATLEGANQETDSRETSTVEPVSSTTRKRHDLRTYLEDCEDRDERMVQGRTTVARYNKTICIGGELELHLQPPERSSPGSNPQTFEYSLEWVAAEKLHSSKAPGAASIIDLEQLKQEKTFELDNKDQLLIGVREIIIQISRSGKNKTSILI